MTTHEMLARDKKARALVAAVRRARLSAGDVRKFTAVDWIAAVASVNCKPPSQATKDLVIRMLEEGSEP